MPYLQGDTKMNDETQSVESATVKDTDTSVDYIATINDLNTKIKEDMVSKEDYMKLRKENQKLLNSLVNGDPVKSQANQQDTMDDAIRKLTNKRSSNLDVISSALKIRELEMEKGNEDPWVPHSRTYEPTANDFEKSKQYAEVLQELVDEADGDSNRFNSMLASVVK